jgi:hypothetical protein
MAASTLTDNSSVRTDMANEALLGGLIGSVLTIFITKILDIVQKRQEHRYSLQKLFFEKKLQAAESTISLLSKVSSAVFAVKFLFESITDQRIIVGEDFMTIWRDSLQSILEKTRTYDVSSISLFFDFEKGQKNISLFKSIIHSLSSLKILAEYMKLYANNKEIDNSENIKKSRTLMTQHFELLSKNMEILEKSISDYSDKIRLDLKRFEI